jgi:hypothetical protein
VPDRYDLGLLFVHGIGAQQRGDTLLQFGEPLMDSLTDWLGADGVVVHSTDLLAPAPDEPAHTCATVTAHGEHRTVVAAESWWAETFHPPRYWPLAIWLVWATPFVVYRLTDHRVGLVKTNNRIDAHRDPAKSLRREALPWLVRQAQRVVLNVFSAALALVATVAIMLLGVVAVIPAVRRFILSAQTVLVRYIGDSYTLLLSPLRADAMVSQVETDLAWLEAQRPSRVVVIAHSQGAEIVRRVLERRAPDRPVASLVTLGSGIAKLRAVALMYAKHWSALWAYVLRGLAAVLTLAGGPALVWLGLLTGGVASLVALVAAAALIAYAREILVGIVGKEAAVHDDLERAAARVRRWIDFYATSDPVPEGRLPLEDLGLDAAASTEIANRRSPLLDHTTYWQNAEAFRPGVIEELAGHLGWPLTKVFTDRIDAARATRGRSTIVLVVARWALALPAVCVCVAGLVGVRGFAAWDETGMWIGPKLAWAVGQVNDSIAKWLERDPGGDAVTAACVVLAALVIYAGVAAVWGGRATARGRKVFVGG